jgi:hypothetical protein
MRNEIKISFDEPQYEVNPEKGTVECFLKYEVLYPDFLQGVFFYGEKIYFFSKAIAKVNEGDVFDENIGKKISLAKAEAKAYKQVGKYCFKKCGQLGKAYNKLYDFYAKAKLVVDHNSEYINKF